MKSLLFLASITFLAAAASPGDQRVPAFKFESAQLPVALRVVSRLGGVPIHVDPDVTGVVSVDFGGGTVGHALATLLTPGGYHWTETADSIGVHRLKTVLYRIDYPQLTRSGSGNASITLGGANAGGLSTIGSPVARGDTSDATQVSISQENQNTFWTGLEAELRAMLKEGDSLVFNRFSGVAQVTAAIARQRVVGDFLELVNQRITQQVEIEARLVEVTLRDEQKLGIDWELAAGGNTVGSATASLDLPGVGGSVFSANTFSANLGFQRASAVIHALKQQGDVRTVAQPRLRALNNQTAFIKVGEDRPFFRLQQSTTFQPGTSSINTTQEQFSVSTITIGTILAVTPQIDAHGVIALDVLPAITRLQSIVTSPDGRQTAPVTEVKQASTIVRLKDGETAVIGGLISEETGDVTRSVPGLEKAPLIGRAFRSKAAQRVRTELVIFLTPHLVR